MGGLTIFLILGLVTVLAGCTAGRNFERPTPETVVLGSTSRADVLEKYGPPVRQSAATIGFQSEAAATPKGSFDVSLAPGSYVSLTYAFAERALGLLHDFIYTRAVNFLFWNDRLVAYNFVSSFEQDSSNFDEFKTGALQKGKTTKAEVAQLLGPPTGRSIFPLVQAEGQEVFSYGYAATDLSTRERMTKGLQVLFAADGTVLDYRFGSNVNPLPPPSGGGSPIYVPIITPKR